MLAKHRLGAVERLQHEEVGHLRDAVAELAHARRERARALVDEAVQQRRVRRQLLGRVDAGLRRDVERVEQHLVVAAPLHDARDAEQRVALAGLLGANQAQVERAGLHGLGLVGGVRVVAQLLAVGLPAAQLVRLGSVEADLRHAFARQRHGEADQLALHVGRDVERHRLRVVQGHRERRAVGKDAARAGDADAADRQHAGIERELEEAPGVRPGAAQAHVDRVLDMTGFLLKVMRQQEHPLRPDDLAVQAHEARRVTC